jgi:hypothetical protein
MPPAAKIVVRAYVVGFGDCVVARIPDGDAVRHMLIDFGRAPGKGAGTSMFAPVARSIAEFCRNHLDLVVVTHEHLDHIEGFYHQRRIFDQLEIDQVWMGLPSHPTYYRDYPDAQPLKRLRDLAGRMLAARGLFADPGMRSLLENNLSNVERIEYLRNVGRRPPQYLARGKRPARSPFSSVGVDILAPEKDVSVYYPGGKVNSLAAAAELAAGAPRNGDWWSFPGSKHVPAPPNLTQSEWSALRGSIRGGSVVSARFIDRAQNNTSLCFVLTVGNKRLLFAGDAELESWEMIAEKAGPRALAPVDFIKVSHHGSHNGTPLDLLDRLLPTGRKRKAVALLSTLRDVYGTENPVPDARVLTELSARCREVCSTDGVRDLYVEVEV